jgi:quinol monooxygenase YgiN
MFFSLFLILEILFEKTTGLTAMTLALNYKCTVKPGQREAWLTKIQDDQLCTRRDEPGNLQFIVGQDVDDENTFYLHEEFNSMAAFQDHCASKHYARYDAFLKSSDPFIDEPEINFYQPQEEDDSVSHKKRPSHKNAFGLNVNLYPKATVREDFLKVISDNKKGTDSTEELALQYTYGEATTVEGVKKGAVNVFHFHEQYTGKELGKEGFNAHASTPHFVAWEDFVSTDPFERDPEVFFFHIIEP